jgi:methylenetetrahydrofolate reductase (NADPH)
MRIADELQKRATLSFEFFPPRDDIGFWDLYRTIEKLKPLDPSFVSVTYGAGGSTRRKTVDLVARIKSDIQIEGLAHLTCVGSSRRELADVVDELKSRGVENILTLRGDPPQDQEKFERPADGFGHANELASFIKDRHDFCLGGACHPETHPEAASPDADLDHLKRKVDAGCDFLVTQLFFDNATFYRFRDQAAAKGVTVPIVAGIMPVLSVTQIKRFTEMCGASIPQSLLEKIEAVEDDVEAVRQIGMYHATEQCRDLLEHDVAGIHFYTLNRSTATRAVYQQIKGQVDARALKATEVGK